MLGACGHPPIPGNSRLIVLREHHMPEPEIDHSVAASLTAQIAITATDDLPGQAPKPEL